MDWGSLKQVEELAEVPGEGDDTPTGALRRLERKREITSNKALGTPRLTDPSLAPSQIDKLLHLLADQPRTATAKQAQISARKDVLDQVERRAEAREIKLRGLVAMVSHHGELG